MGSFLWAILSTMFERFQSRTVRSRAMETKKTLTSQHMCSLSFRAKTTATTFGIDSKDRLQNTGDFTSYTFGLRSWESMFSTIWKIIPHVRSHSEAFNPTSFVGLVDETPATTTSGNGTLLPGTKWTSASQSTPTWGTYTAKLPIFRTLNSYLTIRYGANVWREARPSSTSKKRSSNTPSRP
jgi:hypothetical protein